MALISKRDLGKRLRSGIPPAPEQYLTGADAEMAVITITLDHVGDTWQGIEFGVFSALEAIFVQVRSSYQTVPSF